LRKAAQFIAVTARTSVKVDHRSSSHARNASTISIVVRASRRESRCNRQHDREHGTQPNTPADTQSLEAGSSQSIHQRGKTM